MERSAGSFKYPYSLRGQTESVTFPSGLVRGFTYDDQGRLGQLSHFDPVAGNLATYAYDYDFNHATSAWDRLGQRTGMRATVPSQSLSNALTKYHYDPLYQLTRVDYPNVAPFNGEVHSWTYDAIGNRLTNTVGATTQTYTYYKVAGNPNNYQRLTSDGVNSYTYDARGNILTKIGLNFGWTDDNQIWTLSGAATADYRYDYQNRRRSKTVSGQATSYLYDGLNLIAESGASTAEYLFGAGIDEPLAMRRGGQIYYYVTDGLGSVNLVTNTGGAVQNKYSYDAWGVTRSQTGSLGNSFGYTAREAGEAGFLFYRARYHSPAIGRFLSEDPVRWRVGSLASLYSYVGGTPTSFVDPEGTERVDTDGGNQPCQKNEGLADCGEPGSGCCVAKCIDDLRFSMCLRRQDQKAFKWIGVISAGGVGFRLGLPLGLPGACGGAVLFGAAGYYGFFRSYYGYQWAATTGGQQAGFDRCMKGCGVECLPDKPCLVDNLFRQVMAE